MDEDLNKAQGGPLEAYQWSAVKLTQQLQMLKRLGIALSTSLLAALLIIIIWAAASFGSSISAVQHEQHAEQAQAQAYHKDQQTANRNLECQTAALDQLLTEFSVAQAAQQAHKPVPTLTIPKPC